MRSPGVITRLLLIMLVVVLVCYFILCQVYWPSLLPPPQKYLEGFSLVENLTFSLIGIIFALFIISFIASRLITKSDIKILIEDSSIEPSYRTRTENIYNSKTIYFVYIQTIFKYGIVVLAFITFMVMIFKSN